MHDFLSLYHIFGIYSEKSSLASQPFPHGRIRDKLLYFLALCEALLLTRNEMISTNSGRNRRRGLSLPSIQSTRGNCARTQCELYACVCEALCVSVYLACSFVTSISVLNCAYGHEILILSPIKHHTFPIYTYIHNMLHRSADEEAKGHSPGSHGGLQFRCSWVV